MYHPGKFSCPHNLAYFNNNRPLTLLGPIKRLGQCFPKSGPRIIFGPQEFLIWSARIKIVAILSKFGIKRVIFVEKLPILWSVEDFVEILWSAKFFSLHYGPQTKKVWETLV